MRIMKDYWDARLYDGKHGFVSSYGNSLIELLASKKEEKILDVGCGTGDLAQKMFELGAQVEGIDQSESMVEEAKSKYPHISFSIRDVLELDSKNEYQAVFSNATLHWVKPPKQALQNIYTSLKPGGRFVAEFGGKGNVQTIIDEIINQLHRFGIKCKEKELPWYFPSIAEYTSLMEEVGFRVTYAEHFDRPTPLIGEDGLRNWIQMFASSLIDGISQGDKGKILAQIERNLEDRLKIKGQWIADYKRIRVVGIKE